MAKKKSTKDSANKIQLVAKINYVLIFFATLAVVLYNDYVLIAAIGVAKVAKEVSEENASELVRSVIQTDTIWIVVFFVMAGLLLLENYIQAKKGKNLVYIVTGISVVALVYLVANIVMLFV